MVVALLVNTVCFDQITLSCLIIRSQTKKSISVVAFTIVNGLVVLSQNWTFGYKYDSTNVAGGKHQNWFNFAYMKTAPTNQWTIHGLWPDNCNGSYNTSALGCDPKRIYTDVQTRLQTYNPTFLPEISKTWIAANGDTNWFWSHEWTKHATCFSPVDTSCYPVGTRKDQDIVDFFGATLSLAKSYNAFNILMGAKIVPSDTITYTISAMNAAFSTVLKGYSSAFQCVTDSAGKQYVVEVWMYFYSAPGLTFVPASTANKAAVGYSSNCNTSKPVYYLPNLY
ncbi:ribonuclease T2-like [Blyttiomyces sp. JEL0837]|nr:ribonuclease T2-like [Blyttiomyces sp. JEL0837]